MFPFDLVRFWFLSFLLLHYCSYNFFFGFRPKMFLFSCYIYSFNHSQNFDLWDHCNTRETQIKINKRKITSMINKSLQFQTQHIPLVGSLENCFVPCQMLIRIVAVNCFRKKASSQMLNRVLTKPLIRLSFVLTLLFLKGFLLTHLMPLISSYTPRKL